MAVLIVPTTNTSLNTYCRAIVDTWGKVARSNKSLSVDLWFATSEDTLHRFGWPNIPGFEESEKKDKDRQREKDKDGKEDKDVKNERKVTEKEDLKQMMAELLKETMVFKEPKILSDEQNKFKTVTKVCLTYRWY